LTFVSNEQDRHGQNQTNKENKSSCHFPLLKELIHAFLMVNFRNFHAAKDEGRNVQKGA